MTNCTTKTFEFPAVKRKSVIAAFDAGRVTSDGGGLLLREAEKRLKLLDPIAEAFPDNRDQSKVTHSVVDMVRQRVFGIALGYEDLNDHDSLRDDPALQTMVGTNAQLASSPTLCRLENTADRRIAVAMNKQFIESFIANMEGTPERLVLDFDATDDIVHGMQEGRYYHGYYDNYCFLPLYVFCGTQLLIAYLRSSNKDGARHAWAILSLLVKRFRQAWPNVEIIFRGDSGFNRHQMLRWCEKKGVYYIVGQARNKRLENMLAPSMAQAELKFQETNRSQRIFFEFSYAAGSWECERRVIGKAEYTDKGANPRFIVTNLAGNPKELYEELYCARGEMENRIKEVQLGLFSDRTSCHKWWPNQLRMLFSACAYVLIDYIRRIGLAGTILAKAQVGTIRLKLFKIGATVIENTRKIRFLLSSSYPLQPLFLQVYQKFVPT
jgi:hypothetical protein